MPVLNTEFGKLGAFALATFRRMLAAAYIDMCGLAKRMEAFPVLAQHHPLGRKRKSIFFLNASV